MEAKQRTDMELWVAVKEGNTRAFDKLFDRYWSAIYSTAYFYLKDHTVATDIVHDIFLNIWKKRSSYDIVSFHSYLTTAARYHVYKVLKNKKAGKLSFIADYKMLPDLASSANEGEENLKVVALENQLACSLARLPARCRQIFMLSRKLGWSNAEIARKFGISKRTVENQLSTAMHIFRPLLKYKAVLLLLLWNARFY
jgi:RNA polymerase sigma-70 factor (family 1)